MVKRAEVVTDKPKRNPEEFVGKDGLIRIRLGISVRDPKTSAMVAWPLGAPSIKFSAKTPQAVEKVLSKLEVTLQSFGKSSAAGTP